MRREPDQPQFGTGSDKHVTIHPLTECGVGIVTGIRGVSLTEHARHLSNQTLEPVLQYVYATTDGRAALLRRHWLAGLAPNVALIVDEPPCVGCAILADLMQFAVENRPPRTVAILPAGTDPRHLAQSIDHHEALHVRYLRTIVDAQNLLDDISSSDDLHTTELVSWHGDQRWVAHAALSLISAADQVLVLGQSDREISTLIRHLSPGSIQQSETDSLPETQRTFASTLTVHDQTRHSNASYEPAAGIRTTQIASDTPMHPQRLLDAVTEVADHVIRIEGIVRLATRPDHEFNLHVSAGLASLDPTQSAPTDDSPTWLLVTTAETSSGFDPHDTVLAKLKSAFLSDSEYRAGSMLWQQFADPLP